MNDEEIREEFEKKRAEGKIPPATLETLELYVYNHYRTGGFLRSFLANDLMQAVARADSDNSLVFRELAQLVHWGLPSRCHGSYEKVDQWLTEGNDGK